MRGSPQRSEQWLQLCCVSAASAPQLEGDGGEDPGLNEVGIKKYREGSITQESSTKELC